MNVIFDDPFYADLQIKPLYNQGAINLSYYLEDVKNNFLRIKSISVDANNSFHNEMLNDGNLREEIFNLFLSSDMDLKYYLNVHIYYVKLLYTEKNINFNKLVNIIIKVLEQILDSNYFSSCPIEELNENITFYKNVLNN